MIENFILQHEIMLRISFFLGFFILFACGEFVGPKRKLTVSKYQRWMSNLSLVTLNSLIIRILFPTAAVGMAFYAQKQGWGLFNYFVLPHWVATFISIFILDLAIYGQHRLFHAVPFLWRVHRMHHTDLDLDVSSGVRFHPLEIILSMLIKFTTIIIFGAPVVAVIIFEILLNITSMFNHSNLNIPVIVDKILRKLIVTPDMHRVHHSLNIVETNTNFGFNFPWWDHIFQTYRAQPALGHHNMVIGIKTFRDTYHCIKLMGMLYIPFLNV